MNFTTTTMSAPPTSASDRRTQRAMARKAGWHLADLTWEGLQEAGNAHLLADDHRAAAACFRRAAWLAYFCIARDDPRRATSLANQAAMDRLAGREKRARRRYAEARRIWAGTVPWITGMTIARRARSSLFHLRMEARHWDTYQENMRTRMARFATETGEALAALEQGSPSPHRLYGRWRGEKPAVFDDTRKLLAAALLVAGDPARSNSKGSGETKTHRRPS